MVRPFKECDMQKCEFCQELQGHSGARFTELYPDIDSRIVARTANFVALPTLGQLFPGSLLVLPREHRETCAELSRDLRNEMCAFLYELLTISRRFGEPVFFEHGASAHTGGSCGIYHAHLHVVPLPSRVRPSLLFDEHQAAVSDLAHALQVLTACDHYLLLGNESNVVYSRVDCMAVQPSSQYFRRKLAQRFGVTRPWDWRQATIPEPDLIATLQAFGGSNANHRRSHTS
jgi:diadenosine tetraphosphate (Ap4A) HIT family hydrolase